MSARIRDALIGGLGQLRHEPTAKRIRALQAGAAVVDSTRAVLVWEPRRMVPAYAVPADDVRGELVPAAPVGAAVVEVASAPPEESSRPVLGPLVPFAVHTADGEALDLRTDNNTWPGAAYQLSDPDLSGYVVLDFAAFDQWYEEDAPNVGHPRDPFHRIDALASSRHLQLEREGELLADTSRPVLLFESMLPTRYYLPREDVRVRLIPSAKRTHCAYKGQASYLSAAVGDQVLPDLAWTYDQPLHDASHVRDLIAFVDERADVILDGKRQERAATRLGIAPSEPGDR